MLYLTLIVLFMLLGLVRYAPAYGRRTERRQYSQPYRLAATPAERKAGRVSRALWNQ